MGGKSRVILALFLAVKLFGGGDVVPVEPVYEEVETADEELPDTSVGAFIGTKGVGVEYSKRLGIEPNTVMKFSVSGIGGVSGTVDDGSLEYNADISLFNLGVTFDYHPFCNGFFVSAGGFYNGNKLSFQATPVNDTYTINGNVYRASDVGSVSGETNFNSFVPYFGLGYDNSLFGNGNWFFTAKAGFTYQGSPDVKLTSECGKTASAATCSQLKSDVAEAEKSLNSTIEQFQIHPDLSVGVAYRF